MFTRGRIIGLGRFLEHPLDGHWHSKNEWLGLALPTLKPKDPEIQKKFKIRDYHYMWGH